MWDKDTVDDDLLGECNMSLDLTNLPVEDEAQEEPGQRKRRQPGEPRVRLLPPAIQF